MFAQDPAKWAVISWPVGTTIMNVINNGGCIIQKIPISGRNSEGSNKSN